MEKLNPQQIPLSVIELEPLVRKLSSPLATAVAAPGRVNLIGEHIDYNDGFVLPMAIQQYVVIAAGKLKTAKRCCSFKSLQLDESFELDLDNTATPDPTAGWRNYVQGVIAGFQELGIEIPSFEAVIHSTVPLGSGLSSSAALEVAIATTLEQLTGHTLTGPQKALLCQRAEHEFVGVPCGIMDQFTSVLATANQLLLIDCQTQKFQHVPLESTNVAILITNSNVKHQLADGEYAKRRSECDSALKKLAQKSWRDVSQQDLDAQQHGLSPTEINRSKHVVSEIQRTLQAVQVLRQNDFETFGELMYQSHNSLRDHYQVSCHELDALVEIAQSIGRSGGVYGSRMTGGGFGGCTVSLVDANRADAIVRRVMSDYQNQTGIVADCFLTKPARGAHVLK